MKKRLEAELISIAHRVLKLKNKSDVNQLFAETQKLYEALSVLKFYGDHIEQLKETISEDELEEKLADSFENKSAKSEPVQKEKEAEILEEAKQVVTAEEESEVTETKVVAVEHDPSVIEQAQQSEAEQIEEEPVVVGEIAIDEDDVGEEVAAEDAGSDPIFEMASEEIEEEKVPENDQKSTRAKPNRA